MEELTDEINDLQLGTTDNNQLTINGKVFRLGCKITEPKRRMCTMMTATETIQLPIHVDLRREDVSVCDQDSINSCTANTVCKQIEYHLYKPLPSRLFQYYNSRLRAGDEMFDMGATIEDSVKALAEYGHVDETMYTYDISKMYEKPPIELYAIAATNKRQLNRYRCILQSEYNIKYYLYRGYIINFGAKIFDNFNATAENGYIVPMPTPSSRRTGGHAMLIVGYDDIRNLFLIQNSWGKDWAMGGYHYMHYAYITNPELCTDFWILDSALRPAALRSVASYSTDDASTSDKTPGSGKRKRNH